MSSEASSTMVILSFPPSYLGDKRTAFGQRLSLTLDLPMLPEEVAGSEVRAHLEVTGFVSSVEPLLVLEFGVKVDAASVGPQMTQVRRCGHGGCVPRMGVSISGRGHEWVRLPLSVYNILVLTGFSGLSRWCFL